MIASGPYWRHSKSSATTGVDDPNGTHKIHLKGPIWVKFRRMKQEFLLKIELGLLTDAFKTNIGIWTELSGDRNLYQILSFLFKTTTPNNNLITDTEATFFTAVFVLALTSKTSIFEDFWVFSNNAWNLGIYRKSLLNFTLTEVTVWFLEYVKSVGILWKHTIYCLIF